MTDSQVIIAAAGPDTKWGNHLEVPRHLAPVDGEPLLHRTVRQALAVSSDVHVTSPDDDRYNIPGTWRHVRTASYVNEYASTRDLWSAAGRTVLLYGDTYYTDNAIVTIASYDGPLWRLFGRYGPSQLTGSPWGEVFGASWLPRNHDLLDQHLHKVMLAYAWGYVRRFTAWELLRSVQGSPLDEHTVSPTWFSEINDLTDDFDFPADYERHPAATPEVASV